MKLHIAAAVLGLLVVSFGCGQSTQPTLYGAQPNPYAANSQSLRSACQAGDQAACIDYASKVKECEGVEALARQPPWFAPMSLAERMQLNEAARNCEGIGPTLP